MNIHPNRSMVSKILYIESKASVNESLKSFKGGSKIATYQWKGGLSIKFGE